MENKMLARRQTKRKIIALQTVIRSQGISNEQKKVMEANYLQLRNNLNDMTATVNVEEVEKRREFVAKNKGLQDIFNAFWLTFMSYTENGCLTKDGHGKFNHGIQVALVGYHGFDEVQANIDADWKNDSLLFGPFNKQGFFDLLFETIETWTEIVDPTYYAAFAWSLLDSIADVTAHPPRLKPVREVKCITKLLNEAAMIKKYISNKKLRMSLALEAESMARVPDVQKRLQARKHGSNFNDNVTNMIEVLSHSFNGGVVSTEDDVSLNSAQSNGTFGSGDPLRDGRDLRKGGINEKEDITDEIEDDVDELRASPLLEKLQTSNGPQAKNISFMDYIRKKRNALIVLNNSIEGLSSSLESSGSILFGFSQNYSDPEFGHQNTDVLSIDSADTSQSRKSGGSWASHNSGFNNFDLSRDPHPDDLLARRNQERADEEELRRQQFERERLEREREMQEYRNFEELVNSGTKWSPDDKKHVSTKHGGDRLGGGIAGGLNSRGVSQGSRGARRDGYEYKVIDINELNRQLALRGTAIPTADHYVARSSKGFSKSSSEHKKPAKHATIAASELAVVSTGPTLEEKFPRIMDEGGDDMTVSTAASSFLMPSVNSRDIPRDTGPHPLTSGLVLESSEVTVKPKPYQRRENFLAVSGNFIKPKIEVKDESLYHHKSVVSTNSKSNKPHRKPATVLDLAALNIPVSSSSNPAGVDGKNSLLVRKDSHFTVGSDTDSVKQMNALYDEYSKQLQGEHGSLLRSDSVKKSVHLLPLLRDDEKGVGGGLSQYSFLRPLTGTSPVNTTRPISPTMKHLTDHYSHAFPHGKFADVLENTHALRNQPPSSPVWSHSRAAKTLKVAAAPVLNALAVEIMTKPMTIYDNIKVMREMNKVSESRSQSPVLRSVSPDNSQAKNGSFERPPFVSAYSEPVATLPSIKPEVLVPEKHKELPIGDMPTIAMHAIIKGLINKQMDDAARMAMTQPSPMYNNTKRKLSEPIKLPEPEMNNTARESAASSYRSISQGGVDIGEFDDESIHSTETPLDVHPMPSYSSSTKRNFMNDVESQLSEPPIASFVDTHLGIPVVVESSMTKDMIDAYNGKLLYQTVSKVEQQPQYLPLTGASIGSSLQGNSVYSLKSNQSLHRASIASKNDAVGNASSIAAVEALLTSSFMKSKLSSKLSNSIHSPDLMDMMSSRVSGPNRLQSELNQSADELDLQTSGGQSLVLQPESSTYITEVPVAASGKAVDTSEVGPQGELTVMVPSVEDEESLIKQTAEPVEAPAAATKEIQETVEPPTADKKQRPRSKISRPPSATEGYTKIKALQSPNPYTVESDSHPFLSIKGSLASPSASTSALPSSPVSPTNSQRLVIKTLPPVYQHNSNFNYDTLETDSLGSDKISLSESMNHIHSFTGNTHHAMQLNLQSPQRPAAEGLIQSLSAVELAHSPKHGQHQSSDVSIASSKPYAQRAGKTSGAAKAKRAAAAMKKIDLAHFQMDRSQSHSRLQMSGSQVIPWLPRGTLIPPDHDRSNHLLGWKEKNLLIRACPVDSSKLVTTIKSQDAIRSAFEEYTKALMPSDY